MISMNVPGIGELSQGECDGWLQSEPVPVPMFGGQLCRIVFDGYEGDARKEEHHAAVANFLAAGPAVLEAASDALYQYYREFEEYWLADGLAPLASAADAWKHVRFGPAAMVSRRSSGDRAVYVSIECECGWEIEHGLEIVLRDGSKVAKLGPCDGHLSNADAYGRPAFEDIVYVSIDMM
jgi:hypothetical protein